MGQPDCLSNNGRGPIGLGGHLPSIHLVWILFSLTEYPILHGTAFGLGGNQYLLHMDMG